MYKGLNMTITYIQKYIQVKLILKKGGRMQQCLKPCIGVTTFIRVLQGFMKVMRAMNNVELCETTTTTENRYLQPIFYYLFLGELGILNHFNFFWLIGMYFNNLTLEQHLTKTKNCDVHLSWNKTFSSVLIEPKFDSHHT